MVSLSKNYLLLFQSINREIAVKMNRKLPLRNIKIIISTKISKFLFSMKTPKKIFYSRMRILMKILDNDLLITSGDAGMWSTIDHVII